ncbi:MAG TPA: outer membrane beta-barrel protein, partial [Phycisphaerae bacterium]|nr:outer membrane beta-barrel protein [Phycisphaerae bacterium]
NTWSFEAGVTRGWNQSLNDNNDAIDFTGRIQWRPCNQNFLQTSFIAGPESGGMTYDGSSYSDNAHYTWAVDTTYQYYPNWNPQLTFAADAVLGYSYNGVGNNFNGGYINPKGMPGGTVMWYDTSLYQYYHINDYLTWNNREEYYYDGGGFTTGGFGQFMPMYYTHGTSVSYGELTTGLKITPFPDNPYLRNLYLRPELRFDMADHAVLTNDKHYQTTLAMDVVYQF